MISGAYSPWGIVIQQACVANAKPTKSRATDRVLCIMRRLASAHESAIIAAYKVERPEAERKQIMAALRGLHERGLVVKGLTTHGAGLPVGWWAIAPDAAAKPAE